ncbi:MAG: PPC domain-containing protein [Chloroflexi bacterium]|nr:PPC domain-containing protein [Chloroflexota bacterium]
MPGFKMVLRKGSAGSLGLVLTILLACWLSVAAQDSGNVLLPDVAVSGALTADASASAFVFDAAPGTTATLSLSGQGSPLALLLSDSSGNAIAQAADSAAAGAIGLADVTLSAGGRYHAFVYFAPGGAANDASYEISLAIAAPAAVPVDAGAAAVEPSLVLLNAGIDVRLSWSGAADLNLEVRDPTGESLYWDSRTTSSGGVFGFDANGLCEVVSDNSVETATWQPGYLPTGSYEIIVYYESACDAQTGSVQFFADVSVDGALSGQASGTLSPPAPGQSSVFVGRFEIVADGSAVVSRGGAYPSTSLSVLPSGYAAAASVAQPITRGTSVTGAITNAQPVVAYRFPGAADEIVSINMQAVGPNLDTLLQLVDPAGTVVDINDDAGGTTNSSIANARLLSSGLYTIVATRYGKELGGTVGQFELTLTGATADIPAPTSALNLPQGDIEVSLYWSTGADLQLLVRDPVGESVYDDNPIVTSGGILAEDGNVNCVPAETGAPVSHIYWPPGRLRPGTYEVEVWYQNTCSDQPPPVDFALIIEVGGVPLVNQIQFPLPGQRYLTNFSVDPSGTASAGEAGFIDAGSRTLAYQSEAFDPPAIQVGQPVSGIISSDNTFDVYGFNGAAGNSVSISMASQTLDTNLYLISPGDRELAANDDADPSLLDATGRSTDSLISEFVLPDNGPYAIIATRYGNQYGGTIGVYSLTLTVNEG